jgi:hypothetical protein
MQVVEFFAANGLWACLQHITDVIYGPGASARALYQVQHDQHHHHQQQHAQQHLPHGSGPPRPAAAAGRASSSGLQPLEGTPPPVAAAGKLGVGIPRMSVGRWPAHQQCPSGVDSLDPGDSEAAEAKPQCCGPPAQAAADSEAGVAAGGLPQVGGGGALAGAATNASLPCKASAGLSPGAASAAAGGYPTGATDENQAGAGPEVSGGPLALAAAVCRGFSSLLQRPGGAGAAAAAGVAWVLLGQTAVLLALALVLALVCALVGESLNARQQGHLSGGALHG